MRNFSNQAHLLLIVIAIVGGCSLESGSAEREEGERWRSLGLSDLEINRVQIHGSTLLAATSDGMYQKEIEFARSDWIALGLQGEDVVDFVQLEGGEILAGVQVEQSLDRPSIYRTMNMGGTWEPYQNGFGGAGHFNLIAALESVPGAPDTIYARGSMNVAKSTDRGASWRSVYLDWDYMGALAPLIYFDPHEPNVIWAGGESAIAQPYLVKSVDYGMTWQHISVDVGGDNACYVLVAHPHNAQELLLGMEGRILYSGDGGETWKTRFEPASYTYFLDMATISHEDRSVVVYAAGSENGTRWGRLTFYRSRDFGVSWDAFIHQDGPNRALIYDLEITEEESQVNIYFGTSHGVYIYSDPTQ